MNRIEDTIMQSIDELARAITQLEPSDQEALLDKVVQLNVQKAGDNGSDSRFQVMQEAMKDELFLADLREVMEDFSHVDAEETPA
ncbi:MAG: hypothetical protein QOH41_4531 [Blastocatellia bacterium]|jgi:hypothetical protein|nr:hypothetical protein [Blastocatellia bacterium]MDX6532241.1 hypothetical protein [Blastocatellia bacterium]